jgi:hypothetical protein
LVTHRDKVSLVRIFPLSEPARYISVRYGDNKEVDTDRGAWSFTTRNLRENTSKPSPGRYIISDVDGNRYDLPNLADLDATSQTMIMRFL